MTIKSDAKTNHSMTYSTCPWHITSLYVFLNINFFNHDALAYLIIINNMKHRISCCVNLTNRS